MGDSVRHTATESGDEMTARPLNIRNIDDVLRAACTDTQAGIVIGKLAGDGAVSLFAAEIAGGKPLRPHYHSRGIEIYFILRGSGVMKTGTAGESGVLWTGERSVGAGDCFAVPEGAVHQFVNTGQGPLRALFCCPADHLDGDRHFIV